jgi:hypothetical protein
MSPHTCHHLAPHVTTCYHLSPLASPCRTAHCDLHYRHDSHDHCHDCHHDLFLVKAEPELHWRTTSCAFLTLEGNSQKGNVIPALFWNKKRAVRCVLSPLLPPLSPTLLTTKHCHERCMSPALLHHQALSRPLSRTSHNHVSLSPPPLSRAAHLHYHHHVPLSPYHTTSTATTAITTVATHCQATTSQPALLSGRSPLQPAHRTVVATAVTSDRCLHCVSTSVFLQPLSPPYPWHHHHRWSAGVLMSL